MDRETTGGDSRKRKVLPKGTTGKQKDEILNTSSSTSDEASEKSATPPDESSPLAPEEIEEAEKIEANNEFIARKKTVKAWDDIIARVNFDCNHCKSKEDAEELLKYFVTIPYFTESMKSRVRSLFNHWFPDETQSIRKPEGEMSHVSAVGGEIQQVSAVERANEEETLESLVALLSAQEKEIVVNQPNQQTSLNTARIFVESHRRTRQAERKIAEAERKHAEAERKIVEKDNTREFAELAQEELIPILTKWSEKLKQIESTLTQLAGFSQAETFNNNSAGTKTEEMLARQAVGDKDSYGPVAAEMPEAAAAIAEARQLPFNFREHQGPQASYSLLIKVKEAWLELIEKKQFTIGEFKKTSEETAKSVERLIATVTDNNHVLTANDGWYFPGAKADEVQCVQPIIKGLLNCIAFCWTKGEPACRQGFEYTPHKTKVKQNQIVAQLGPRNRRIADLCLDKPGKFLYFVFDHTMKLMIEVKPLYRSKQSCLALDAESFRQVTAHVAKFIYRCFNFYGVGVSARATGMTATLAYVCVHELELKMGECLSETGEIAQLVLQRGRKYPLMTPDCFDAWVSQHPTKSKKKPTPSSDISDLRKELYGEGTNPKGGVNEDGIPSGLLVLWEIMARRRCELFGPDYERLFGIDGDLLGIGSFSAIFKVGNESVLKIPTLAVDKMLVHEATILKELSRERSDGLDLVVLEEDMEYSFLLGGTTHITKCLRLSPQGVPILQYLQGQSDEDRASTLVTMSTGLEEALVYIHGRHVVHLDVTPYNIVVAPVDFGWDTNSRAVLVDFGCATKTDAALYGFIGTPKYAASFVFGKYPGKKWKPVTLQDYIGFGLTLSVLANGGIGEWEMNSSLCSMIQKVYDIEPSIKARFDSATAVFEKKKNLFGGHLLEKWSGWIKSDYTVGW